MRKRVSFWIMMSILFALIVTSTGVFALDERSNVITAVVVEKENLIANNSSEEAIQRIAIVMEHPIDDHIHFNLRYKDGEENEYAVQESNRTDQGVLFEKDFSEGKIGHYQLIGLQMVDSDTNESQEIDFMELDIDASFDLIEEENSVQIHEIIIDESDTIEEDIAAGMEKVLENANADGKSDISTDAVSNVVVVLNPGHGGDYPGACYFGLKEKDLNLTIAKACRDELETYNGVTVYLTREDDSTEEAEDIIAFATNHHADLLVSIHNNASTNASAHGFEVIYPNTNYDREIGEEGEKVSESIETELAKLGLYDRGIYTRTEDKNLDDDYEACLYDDGSAGDWYFINRLAKKAGYIGIIVEHAFMSNQSDYENYLSDETQLKKMGVADATGIANYYGLSKKNIAVTGVSLNTTSLSLTIGQTATLNAIITPANAGNQNVTWSSSKSSVATVNNGVVTAVGTGQAMITVKTAEGNKKAYCIVKVTCAKGDVNADGKITLDDVKLAKAAAMKSANQSLSTQQKTAADFNGDGKITINEVRKLRRMVLNLDELQ